MNKMKYHKISKNGFSDNERVGKGKVISFSIKKS